MQKNRGTVPMAAIDAALATMDPVCFRRQCRKLLQLLGQHPIGPPELVHDPKATTAPPDIQGGRTLKRWLERCNRYPRAEEVRAAKRLEFLALRIRHFERRGWNVAAAKSEHHQSQNAFLEGAASFAFNVVRMYQGRRVANEDLLQECFLSLYSAIRLYDWRSGNRFLTYCNEWFHMACHQTIYQTSRTVRITTQVQKKLKKLQDARERVGSDEQAVYNATGLTAEQQRDLDSVVTGSVTLNQQPSEDDESGLTDNALPSVPSVLDTIESDEGRDILRRAVAMQPPSRRKMLGLLWGLDTPDGQPLSHYRVAELIGSRPRTVETLEQACLADMPLLIRRARSV